MEPHEGVRVPKIHKNNSIIIYNINHNPKSAYIIIITVKRCKVFSSSLHQNIFPALRGASSSPRRHLTKVPKRIRLKHLL